MNNLFHIVTFLGALHEPGSSPQRKAELATVQSTLRLWDNICVHAKTLEELRSCLTGARSDRETFIVVVDRIDEAVLAALEGIRPRCEVVLVVDECQAPAIAGLPMLERVSHFISVAHDRTATTTLISAIRKISSREIFGAEKYLSYGTPLHHFILSRSADRQWFVDRFMEYVESLDGVIASGAAEYARMAGEVLDELLMNAIWDANPSRVQADRKVPVTLRPNESVRIEWGVDGQLLAVAVRDPFGSFQKRMLLDYQPEVLGTQKGALLAVNCNGAGAGIGLHKVMRRVSGLVVNLTPGVATEVLALFSLAHSPRVLAKCAKTLHFFSF